MTELDLLIATRRDLHRHPELGFEEHRTAGIVAERLRAAGYEVETGIAVTGVVGRLRGGGGDGPTLLLRADMDALPIQEETSHDYASTTPGRMHACGHDAHVAVGLAVAERLASDRETLPGEIRYLFQPAEEGLGGAARMAEEGVVDGCDAALGLHIWLGLESGVVGVVDGPQMAGSHDFEIVVRGVGGHGAIPDETRDAVYIASQIVVMLQSVVARNVSPLDAGVVSVGAFQAGTAHNVIADSAVLRGTIRAFSDGVAELLRTRLVEVAGGTAAALGGEAVVHFGDRPYPPTANDPALAAIVREAAAEIAGAGRVLSGEGVRTMAAEDFAEFSRRVPGVFFFVGGRNRAVGAVHPHHSPHFELCEEALPVAVDVLERAAVKILTDGVPARAHAHT